MVSKSSSTRVEFSSSFSDGSSLRSNSQLALSSASFLQHVNDDTGLPCCALWICSIYAGCFMKPFFESDSQQRYIRLTSVKLLATKNDCAFNGSALCLVHGDGIGQAQGKLCPRSLNLSILVVRVPSLHS